MTVNNKLQNTVKCSDSLSLEIETYMVDNHPKGYRYGIRTVMPHTSLGSYMSEDELDQLIVNLIQLKLHGREDTE